MTGNIADFLLARIAEDEAAADEWHNMTTDDYGALQTFGDCKCNGKACVLAECEAKRRIIDLRRRLEHSRGGLLGPNKADAATAETLVHVFKLMALPYAGHPDYDPEWRI